MSIPMRNIVFVCSNPDGTKEEFPSMVAGDDTQVYWVCDQYAKAFGYVAIDAVYRNKLVVHYPK